MSEGINLLEPNRKSTTDVFLRRIQTTRFIMVGLLFIVSVSAVILFILVALSPLPALHSQEQSLRQTLASSKSDIVKLELVNERADAIDGVMKKRHALDQTIGLIQSKLSKDSQITAMKGDSKTMTVTVESSSLQSLDSFLNGLIALVQDKKSFSNVTLTDLTTDDVTNTFSVSISLNLL
ncbi:MAG TPA: hypothetical protein VND99_01380 [Candidatus Acidoferrales bacterium]|nr:hypothetical protein [Candidatus Acidoferrales bacterium]